MNSAVKIILREGELPLDLNEKEFIYFSKLIHERAGIYLAPTKIDLVKTRLRKRLQARNISSYFEYRELLEGLPQDDLEWQAFVNILTTNKTDFFREPAHFDFLIEKTIPKWLEGSEKTFKVWSAACSSGEEVYTLAMVLSKHLPKDRDFSILATDIDTNVLKMAENGVYPLVKRHEIPGKYEDLINIGKRELEGWFRISPEIKNKIIFQQHNLIGPETPGENMFDVVLCRNVLIYFSSDTVAQVSRKLHFSTKKDGVCMIGHAESFQNIAHHWKMTAPSVYKK